MVRVPLVSTDELPADHRDVYGPTAGLGDEYTPHVSTPAGRSRDDRRDRPPTLYLALGNNPPILRQFRWMASTLRGACGLSERRREIVILTTARLVEAEYEWHNHVRIALAGALDREEIAAIGDGRHDRFSDKEVAVIEYVAAFVAGDVTDVDHERIATYFPARTIVGIAMLSQFYLGLAHVIDALAIQPTDPFVGWQLEHLDA